LGKRGKYKKMTPHRIAVELLAHGVGYYAGKGLSAASVKRLKTFGARLVNAGKKVQVNNDDPRAWMYHVVWNASRLAGICY
ncbi:MAG: hypothetical protein LLG08_05260, partial [Actinomycetia bacterium]|nr:hypothetical protein [Actinomycetes bacterium]